ncbi:MAG TPA: pyridoxal-phosphate dependent enzyme [Chitinophagales bacterium]|nr:pyridoxal-phosphate dependent enzyme [Chitinophagales bacterium]HMW12933.1 pyridoxal-phosphate dependent enzyme [Chitinophagales bacterium]HMX60155.1 pyridoxal-phosphate dependent enzyme [Chitinophagales bacterium]HMY23365.1 pyridoxal-phosphate dependent enzyme [Chitinophagales bacterium]HMZ33629.1 pyridoxal-phosphate dependent enzyme [Chitinophagales bacterium]
MFQLPSPLQKIENEWTKKFDIQLYIKRDDLIHAAVSGNKWRKLKYNLTQAKYENKNTILTFGGAYSNHITATAKACELLGFNSIGIIRGEAYFPLNKSLQFAADCGMQLLYLDREHYRNKNISPLLEQIETNEAAIFIVPEGGANEYAIQGCTEIVDEINQQLMENYSTKNFDFICCASGTGTTIAGISMNLLAHQTAIGFSVLKHDTLKQEILSRIPNLKDNFSMQAAHFGGYAKTTPALLQFIRDFYKTNNIILDYVYTGKMMYAFFDMLSKGFFPSKSTIVVVHTGGVMNANLFEE